MGSWTYRHYTEDRTTTRQLSFLSYFTEMTLNYSSIIQEAVVVTLDKHLLNEWTNEKNEARRCCRPLIRQVLWFSSSRNMQRIPCETNPGVSQLCRWRWEQLLFGNTGQVYSLIGIKRKFQGSGEPCLISQRGNLGSLFSYLSPQTFSFLVFIIALHKVRWIWTTCTSGFVVQWWNPHACLKLLF